MDHPVCIMYFANQMKYYSIDSAISMATHETFEEYVYICSGRYPDNHGIVAVKPIIMTMLQNSHRKTATDVRR